MSITRAILIGTYALASVLIFLLAFFRAPQVAMTVVLAGIAPVAVMDIVLAFDRWAYGDQ